MCKYCKKLKEIKDLEVSDLRKTLHQWRQRDYKARKLMSRLIDMYVDVFFNDNIFSAENKASILTEAFKFIHSDWTGK